VSKIILTLFKSSTMNLATMIHLVSFFFAAAAARGGGERGPNG